MNPTSGQNKTAILILIALVITIIVGVVVQIWVPDFNVISFIGVVSTLSIALLTVAYVIVTSSQLKVMRGQLSEMARTRELDAQPLPLLQLNKICLERPRFFYTPPEDSYHANPRLAISYNLTNQGIHPAVNIIAAARLIMRIDGNEFDFDGGADEISVIGASADYPPDDEHHLHFLFTNDELANLVKVLRDRSYQNPPLISIRGIYKNVLGACFSGTCFFEFSPKSEEDFEILVNWDTKLVSFDTEYKEELKQLQKMQAKDEESWATVFKTVRERLNASLEGDEELELAWAQIPNSFRSEVISKERYETEVRQRSFGRRIPKWITSCIAKDESE